jgi:hypothetical protein
MEKFGNNFGCKEINKQGKQASKLHTITSKQVIYRDDGTKAQLCSHKKQTRSFSLCGLTMEMVVLSEILIRPKSIPRPGLFFVPQGFEIKEAIKEGLA